MSLEKDIADMFSRTPFNEACALLLSDKSNLERLEKYLIFCVHYVNDARVMASNLLLLGNNRVTNKGVILTPIKGQIAVITAFHFLEKIKSIGNEALAILKAFPFGETLPISPDTLRILYRLDIGLTRITSLSLHTAEIF